MVSIGIGKESHEKLASGRCLGELRVKATLCKRGGLWSYRANYNGGDEEERLEDRRA